MNRNAHGPRLRVFSLGGTIASTVDSSSTEGGVTPTLSAEDLTRGLESSLGDVTITTTSFRQTASSNLRFDDILALASQITASLQSGVDGVVVTQGTSTIEETAFALDLLVDSDRPVVVTGAMRNPTLEGADGRANLLSALRVARSPTAGGLGAMVVFNEEVHAARFVRKSHTSSPGAFVSPATGPIGWIVEDRVRVATRPPRFPSIPLTRNQSVPAVALLKMTLGDDGRLIDVIDKVGYAGLVIEAFGAGHVPADLVPSVQRLAEHVPVVLASRTGAGEVLQHTYGFAGGERDLLARGLLNAGYLDGPKARILLGICLGAGGDIGAVRSRFGAVVNQLEAV